MSDFKEKVLAAIEQARIQETSDAIASIKSALDLENLIALASEQHKAKSYEDAPTSMLNKKEFETIHIEVRPDHPNWYAYTECSEIKSLFAKLAEDQIIVEVKQSPSDYNDSQWIEVTIP